MILLRPVAFSDLAAVSHLAQHLRFAWSRVKPSVAGESRCEVLLRAEYRGLLYKAPSFGAQPRYPAASPMWRSLPPESYSGSKPPQAGRLCRQGCLRKRRERTMPGMWLASSSLQASQGDEQMQKLNRKRRDQGSVLRSKGSSHSKPLMATGIDATRLELKTCEYCGAVFIRAIGARSKYCLRERCSVMSCS